MNGDVFQVIALGVFILAGLRSLSRISLEGWSKPILVLSSAALILGSTAHWNLSPFFSIVLGILSLFVFARPSRYVRLTRRVQQIVGRLTEGLGLDIWAEVIPLQRIMEDLSSNGLDKSMAKHIINACAGQVEGQAFILFTPGTAALSVEELSFIAAHEIGHQVLGHTREGLLDKLEKVFTSSFGQTLSFGIGSIWKYFIVPRRSQSQEFEADEWAIRRLKRLGLDVEGGLSVFDRFIQEESNEFLSRVCTKLFGTHPPAIDRRARILKHINV